MLKFHLGSSLKRFSLSILFLVLALSLIPETASALLKIPDLSGPVIDEAHFLNEAESAQLGEKIRSFIPKIQMQIWTVNSLEDEPIESLSIRATDKWKLGTEKEDNGILILVAKQERRMRIEVGQGLEGAIPDALAGRIIDQILRPAFKSNLYFEGLHGAADYIYKKATGEEVPALGRRSRERKELPPWLILPFVIFFIIFSIFGSAARRGRYSSGGGWSGGSGGFGGGGGWSGGGGGFSGGGSSGNW